MKTITEIAIQMEQLRDIVVVLNSRYFEESLSNATSERAFIDSHALIGNILTHVETQLTEHVKRLNQAAEEITQTKPTGV